MRGCGWGDGFYRALLGAGNETEFSAWADCAATLRAVRQRILHSVAKASL